ncbi:MAG TPA: hypothetical protein VGP63_22450 [Planctomycetaceae bacterium]|jgi:hypothetical protein|nr:hypothetical protein [Planctomycetaceae bacterium]
MFRSRYAFAGTFFCLGAVLVAWGASATKWASTVLLIWLALDLWLVSLAYLMNWVTVFGKRASGSMRIGPVLLMLPYLAFTWTIWRLQNVFLREPIWNQVAPTIFVGQCCRWEQLPPETAKVIDFTAEFPGNGRARRAMRWLSIPVLDGCAPSPADYRRGFAFVDEDRGSVVYVCCANGHGRSITFACALLVKLGIARTPDEAIASISKCRPKASLNGEQQRSLNDAGIL